MNSNTIIYETKRPAKTFKKQIYLFLGVIMTGLGVYYFVSQANFGRPEEYIPLGLSLLIGLYLLLGFILNLKIPGSKSSYIKQEFTINPSTHDLEYVFESPVLNRKEVLFSLKDVTLVNYREESKNITSTTERVRMDPVPMTAISKTSPSGLHLEKNSSSYTQKKYFLTLIPSNQEILLNVSVPNVELFVKELNKLIEIQNNKA